MINFMRKGINNPYVTRIVIWIMIISMVGFGGITIIVRGLFGPGSSYFMKINSYVISPEAYAQQVKEEESRIAMFKRMFGVRANAIFDSAGVSSNPKVLAYSSLVERGLVHNTARRTGALATRDTAEQKISDPMFLVQNFGHELPQGIVDERGQINIAALDMIMRNGRLGSHFIEATERLVTRKIVDAITSGATYVGDEALKNSFLRSKNSKKVSVVTMSIDHFLQTAQSERVDETTLKAFFARQNNESKKYWAPEQREATVWEFRKSDFDCAVSDNAIEAYYKKHKHNKFIKEPTTLDVRRIVLTVDDAHSEQSVMVRLESILRQLKDGASFADLAHKESEDTDSKTKHGRVMTVKRGSTGIPELERELFRLKEDGDISQAVRSPQGFELYQRVKRTAAVFKPLSEVKTEIKTILERQRFQSAFSSKARPFVRDVMDVKGASKKAAQCQAFARKYHGSNKHISESARQQSPYHERLFTLKKAGSATSWVDGDKGYLLFVESLTKAAPQKFEAVKTKVRDDWNESRARESLDAAARQVRLMMARGVATEDIKKQYPSAECATSSFIAPSDEDNTFLKRHDLDQSALLLPEQIGAVGTRLGAQKIALIRLDAIEAFNPTVFAAEKAGIQAQLVADQRQLLDGAFIASLKRNATIKINEEALHERVQFPIEEDF